jgi:hypothetical protein
MRPSCWILRPFWREIIGGAGPASAARSAAVCALAISLVLAGCGSPDDAVDLEADVTVEGRLLDGRGEPLKQRPVQLSYPEYAPGFLDNRPGPPVSRQRITDEDGRFIFKLKGREIVYPRCCEARPITIDSSPFRPGFRASGAFSSATFEVQETGAAVDLRLWEPEIVTAGGKVTWNPPSPDSSPEAAYEVNLELLPPFPGSTYFGTAWTAPATGQSAELDLRRLEDAKGRVVLRANREVDGVSYSYRSADLDLEGTTGAPASRGRGCVLETQAGIEALSPCPVTDGNLVAEDMPFGEVGEVGRWVRLDLGAPVKIGTVFARSCGVCEVQASPDGVRWSSLGTGDVVTANQSIRARFVRVGLIPNYDGPPEVSVWAQG